jgi:hypothetical protein
MPTYFEIIAYLTALFICYYVRVYISYLWHNKKDNNHKTETYDRNIALFFPTDKVSQTNSNYIEI